MSSRFDITAAIATGNIDREMRRMRREAGRLARRQREGLLTYEEIIEARRRFTGIYRPILKRAIGF